MKLECRIHREGITASTESMRKSEALVPGGSTGEAVAPIRRWGHDIAPVVADQLRERLARHAADGILQHSKRDAGEKIPRRLLLR